MNVHKNYKHTLRALRKWVALFNADRVEGLIDRSSRLHHLRAVTPEQVHRYECEAPGDLISRHQETRAV